MSIPTKQRDENGRFTEGHTLAAWRKRERDGTLAPGRIPSSNEKGLGGTISFRVPVEVIRKVSELTAEAVAKGKYPWKTKGDVMRWLIVAGIESLAAREDEFDDFVASNKVHRTMDEIRGIRVDSQRMFDEITTEVDLMLKHEQEDGDAARVFQVAMENIFDIPDSIWRNILIDKLVARYPALLQDQAIASLMTRRQRAHVLPAYKREAAEAAAAKVKAKAKAKTRRRPKPRKK